MSAAVSEAVAKALSALNRVLPVSVTETPDYAELVFGESKTQAMTLEPQTWLALNELPAILAALQEGSGALPASPSGGQGSSAAPIPTEPLEPLLAELERLARAAVPGPYALTAGFWEAQGRQPMFLLFGGGCDECGGGNPVVGDICQLEATAELAVKLDPATVLKLIAAVRASEVGMESKAECAQPNQPRDREEG